jgi:glycosyltransferase involved in cell wall biosynthesis
MPEVSVIIPTYNRHDMISSTIASVLKQTFTDLEIIIVNDSEDDKSLLNVINQFDDNRIHYLKNQRKKGANGARNTGYKNAKGKYIAFLDDDDRWHVDKIQKQIQKFNESSDDVGIVYSGYEIVCPSSPEFFQNIFPKKRGKVQDDIIQGNFIGSPTPLIKKDVFPDGLPYDENLESAQDWELWIRLSGNTDVDYVDEILAEYVIHGDQISSDLWKKLNSLDYIIMKHGELYNKNKKTLSTIYIKTAVLLLMIGRIKECRKRLIKALVTYWFRRGPFFHLALSLFPPSYRNYVDKNIVRTYDKYKFIF